MRRLRYLLPLLLIVALAVPVGASAHKVRLTPLVNKIYDDVQARFDSSTEWNNYEFYSKSCFLSRGNRLHRHYGGCVVRFDRSDEADEDSCFYQVRLRVKSRSNRFHMPPTYEALEPKDRTCPSRP